jgi:integrase
MQAWRKDMQAKARVERKQRATSGTFEHDARRYLQAVTALPTYQTRKTDIERWIAVFGQTPRASISSADIRAQRDTWLCQTNPKTKQPYAASTINHWLRALSNLYTVLDGRRAPNPVRDVPEVPEPDARPRGVPIAVVEQIINAIPDRGRPERRTNGAKVARAPYSLTKLRLRVLAYTGLTYAQLRRLKATDVDFERRVLFAQRREKGKGSRPRLLPLLPEAVDALKALHAVNGWGRFSGASVRKTFLTAVKKLRKQGQAIPQGLRPYDLRHGFGTLVYRATRSLKTVQDLLMHENPRTTQRYVLSEADQVLIDALEAVGSHSKKSPQSVSH